MKTNKIDSLIAQMDTLTVSESEQLLGGVSTFEVSAVAPVADTNYFQCGCNNYQCGKTKSTN